MESPERIPVRRATPKRCTPLGERVPKQETPKRETPSRRIESKSPVGKAPTSGRRTPRSASTTGRGATPSRSRASPRVLARDFDACGDKENRAAPPRRLPDENDASVAPKIKNVDQTTMMDRIKQISRTSRPSSSGADLDETIPYVAKGRKLTLGSSSTAGSNFTPLPSITLVKDRSKSTADTPFFTKKADASSCLATRKLHSSSGNVGERKKVENAKEEKAEPIVSPGRRLDLTSAKPKQKFKTDSVVDHLMSDSDEENVENNNNNNNKKKTKENTVCDTKDGKASINKIVQQLKAVPLDCVEQSLNSSKTALRPFSVSSVGSKGPASTAPIGNFSRRLSSASSRSSSIPLVASHAAFDMKAIDDFIDEAFDSPVAKKKEKTKEAPESATQNRDASPLKRTPQRPRRDASPSTRTTPRRRGKPDKDHEDEPASKTPTKTAPSVPTTPTRPLPSTPVRRTPRGRRTPAKKAEAMESADASPAKPSTPPAASATPTRRQTPSRGCRTPSRGRETPTRSRRIPVDYTEISPSMDDSPVKRRRAAAVAAFEDQTTPKKTRRETPQKVKRETPSKRSRRSSAAPATNSPATTPTSTPTKTKAATPSKPFTTPKRNPPTPSRRARDMTPGTKARATSVLAPGNQLEAARARLHVSAVPDSLPCRDNEFETIFNFVKGNLTEGVGGCMYVSGVPGTGKTATAREVMRALATERTAGRVGEFLFIDINGMRLTDPRQAYVAIHKELTGQKATADHACTLLDKRFSATSSRRPAVVLLVDELDLLMTPKQDVLYNVFDWPSRSAARLTVLAIANTMDLPERVLMNRVASRLGLTRLIFQPYTFKQLQEIVVSRTTGLKCFSEEAVQFAARKVAAVSGDARRALDICRRATEIAERGALGKKIQVSISHVQQALDEMYSSPLIVAMKAASLQEQILLRAVVAEFRERGVEEALFHRVFEHHKAICRFEALPVLRMSDFSTIANHLNDSRLLLLEAGKLDIHRRVRLNVAVDDVNFALRDVDFAAEASKIC